MSTVYNPNNPLIVQSDNSVLLETSNPAFEECRDVLSRFCELVKSPEYPHTYRITPLSLWNARAAGMQADEMLAALRRFSKYPLPPSVEHDVRDYVGRYGRLTLRRGAGALLLTSHDPVLITELANTRDLQRFFTGRPDETTLRVPLLERGRLKQAMVKRGFPVEDLAGYTDGEPLAIGLRPVTVGGAPFGLREYQREAVDAYWAQGTADGGAGVVVLPCGAGKTVVAMGAMAAAGCSTLVLTTSITALRQWRTELLDKTTLDPDQIGEYSGERKEIRPVTLSTYQVMSYRKAKGSEDFPHLEVFNQRNWGLIVYDEVHLLPAPVFRVTAEIQARRRLGLTATLVREDHREDDVFSLIGPKKFDVPWKQLEQQGWIAEALCTEVRVPMPDEERLAYAVATEGAERFRIASENSAKIPIVHRLLEAHRDDRVLVIGQYLGQLHRIAEYAEAVLITGKTPQRQRERQFEAFREGRTKVLVVSKVANFSIDLPEANVALQVSGMFGSRQEEAQRLGRILRPKRDGGQARFYTLVSHDTDEQRFAVNRQLFLVEQGYRYEIVDA